jgi:hypothetical protein
MSRIYGETPKKIHVEQLAQKNSINEKNKRANKVKFTSKIFICNERK